jgi:acetyltransferase-like isoleucine patch superfamily enzyme
VGLIEVMVSKSLKSLILLIQGLPKTIIFNLKYFPFQQAIRFPVFVSHRVWLKTLSGKVKISNFKTGIIKIGFGDVSIFDQQRSRTIWDVSGFVEFNGRANIGHGSKISVIGVLSIGNEFSISAESSIIAQKHVSFGDNVLISWGSLIMDSDFHKIYNSKGIQINCPLPIRIGNKVWIGCRTLILKGVNLADGIVVAASSTVSKSIEIPNSIVGGIPAKIIQEQISWEI